jgi:hypothetical protein
LMKHLWPGDWQSQLRKINDAIEKRNQHSRQNLRKVSEHDFWVFIGILIVAAPYGK